MRPFRVGLEADIRLLPLHKVRTECHVRKELHLPTGHVYPDHNLGDWMCLTEAAFSTFRYGLLPGANSPRCPRNSYLLRAPTTGALSIDKTPRVGEYVKVGRPE